MCSKVEELVSTVTTFPFARNRVHAWLESGADPDMDIYPTIEARKTRWKGRSLEYFDDGIASSIASRTKPLPAGEAKQGKFDPAAFIRANFDENGKPKAKVAE